MRLELAGQMTPSIIDPVPPTPANLLWEDHFSGLEGTAPDSDFWILGDTRGNVNDEWCTCDPDNAFLDGDGHLVLRTKRDVGGTNGLEYSGAHIATFNAWGGYPASN